MKSYKIKLKMRWEFIVVANSEEETINKLNDHLGNLMKKDGYTSNSIDAINNIKANDYIIEEYEGSIIL